MHYHETIQVFGDITCHLQMMCEGSISCNYLHFATLALFSVLSLHLECISIYQAGKAKGDCGECGR